MSITVPIVCLLLLPHLTFLSTSVHGWSSSSSISSGSIYSIHSLASRRQYDDDGKSSSNYNGKRQQKRKMSMLPSLNMVLQRPSSSSDRTSNSHDNKNKNNNNNNNNNEYDNDNQMMAIRRRNMDEQQQQQQQEWRMKKGDTGKNDNNVPQEHQQQQQQWSSFVDKIYLITCPNADPDSVRLNKARSVLARAGIPLDDVDIKRFDTDDEDRIRGCYTSHISVLTDALRDARDRNGGGGNDDVWMTKWQQFLPSLFDSGNTKNTADNENVRSNHDENKDISTKKEFTIMVVEDNIDFGQNFDPSILQNLQEFISSTTTTSTTTTSTTTSQTNKKHIIKNTNNSKDNNKDENDDTILMDMIHLSYIPYVPNLIVTKTPTNPNMVQLTCGIGSALGTTAYIITLPAIRSILDNHERNGYYAAIPDIMAELFPQTRYAPHPTPFLRAPRTRSLVNPQLDDLREYLFRPSIVYFAQSILTMTQWSSNDLFFSIILLLVGGILIPSAYTTIDAIWQIGTYGSYRDGGNLFVPLVGAIFSLGGLGILVYGALLAPKPPSTSNQLLLLEEEKKKNQNME
eukprot:CAMPEP_0184862194 /NCGR_PEP_ID=MMETSP0580-20130426/6691_1 /TAXON_ID=1118495 /ORGANISM="Dactyliosolen fragilissimus" /LENGTH=570 /DNA_ID=CAMNT_0027359949 /DNA_START=15 /DNA_END=1727 /DNA_ORIENTATION=+